MECNAVCQGIGQFLGNACLWFLVVAVIYGIGGSISASRAKRLRNRRLKLEATIRKLQEEIAGLPLPTLTSEAIPQRFRSVQEAKAFGKKWSRGGADSFSVGSFDADGLAEYHPQYDPSRVAGGMLYAQPALFFGLKVAYIDNEEWRIDFLRAKEAWLRSYRGSVRQPTRGIFRREPRLRRGEQQ